MNGCCKGRSNSTNHRTELTGTIEGLRALKCQSQVEIMTDSDYVRRGVTEFMAGWKSRNWINSTGKAVANRDLWEELDELTHYHEVAWTHVGGHSEHRDQERADELATEAARRTKQEARVLEPPSWPFLEKPARPHPYI